jgi:hypothetical protein
LEDLNGNNTHKHVVSGEQVGGEERGGVKFDESKLGGTEMKICFGSRILQGM